MSFITRKKIRTLYIKLIKQTGSPDFVARGVAVGFFIAFLIPIGFQMILALALAWLLKAKKIPAIACTWITNPWSVIVIYPIQCYVGAKILGTNLTFSQINESIRDFIKLHTWESFTDLGADIIGPFILGGAVFGIITGVISYFTAYGIIVSHRNRVKIRLAKRLAVQAQWKVNMEEKNAVSSENNKMSTADNNDTDKVSK